MPFSGENNGKSPLPPTRPPSVANVGRVEHEPRVQDKEEKVVRGQGRGVPREDSRGALSNIILLLGYRWSNRNGTGNAAFEFHHVLCTCCIVRWISSPISCWTALNSNGAQPHRLRRSFLRQHQDRHHRPRNARAQVRVPEHRCDARRPPLVQLPQGE